MTAPSSGPTGAAEGRWDTVALRAGGSVALVLAVPLSLAARVVDDSSDGSTASGLSQLLAVAALLMFVIGAGVAAWYQQKGTPLMHGIVAAVGAFLLGQAVFLAVKLISGDDVDWLRVAMSLTLTLVAGTLGGFLGSVLQRSGAQPGRRG